MSAKPPTWLRERATAEGWPSGSITQWRRQLRQLNIESVHAIYMEGKLAAIELDGLSQEIDQQHPAPIDNALRDAVTQLRDRGNRPPGVS
jgi:hypothetical protein